MNIMSLEEMRVGVRELYGALGVPPEEREEVGGWSRVSLEELSKRLVRQYWLQTDEGFFGGLVEEVFKRDFPEVVMYGYEQGRREVVELKETQGGLVIPQLTPAAERVLREDMKEGMQRLRVKLEREGRMPLILGEIRSERVRMSRIARELDSVVDWDYFLGLVEEEAQSMN